MHKLVKAYLLKRLALNIKLVQLLKLIVNLTPLVCIEKLLLQFIPAAAACTVVLKDGVPGEPGWRCSGRSVTRTIFNSW